MEIKLGFSCILASILALCSGKIWEIPIPQTLQDCYNLVQHANIETYVGSTYSWFCETAIKKSQMNGPPQFDAQKASYYQHLYTKTVEFNPNVGHGGQKVRGKRQAGQGRCIRKEYRMLTDDERNRFHNAVNRLKRDTTVEPNKYDAIALLHTGMAAFTAHGGAGFPGWHRIYILMFETALREEDPTVCLPYWDSTLDNELEDPTLSPVWTRDFFGTAQGPVVDGPFADWVTPEGVQLIRNVGSDGELFTASAIEDVLSRTRHDEILTSEDVEPRFDLEFHHAAVHVFCGGTMGQLDTAAFDPVFFLHHSFVDYVWELFRTNMAGIGLNPETYPVVADTESRHHSTAPTGFGDLTQADGYLSGLTESYEYESAPICTARFPECGSRYLTCLERIGRCVPVNPDIIVVPNPNPNPNPIPNPRPNPVPNPVPNPNPPPRPLPGTGSPTPTCSQPAHKLYGMPVQNDYCCDKTCDTNEWAMIPVKIVSVRPPKFSQYNSFPVHNGRVDAQNDIYSPRAYAQTNRYITTRQSNPKTYQRCANDDNIGQVFLSSKGINYDGYYKEAAIIDHRLAVSISMGFVAIKKPTRGSLGVSKAIVRAHDSCGRVCHAACKDPVTNEYKECSGAVALSSDTPLMYGTNYDDAVMSVFDYEFDNDCPRFKSESFFMTFYCDYHNEFPYAQHSHGSPAPRPPVVKPVPVSLPSTKTSRGHDLLELTGGILKAIHKTVEEVQATNARGCQVTTQCILDVPCSSQFKQCNIFNEKHVCRGSCRAYGVCTYGRFFLRLCPDGEYFDDDVKRCVRGFCQKVTGGERILGGQANSNSYADRIAARTANTHAQSSTRYQSSRVHSSPIPSNRRTNYADMFSGFVRTLGR